MADELRPLIDHAVEHGFGICVERKAGLWCIDFIRGMGGGPLSEGDDLDETCIAAFDALDDCIARSQEFRV